MVEEVNERGRKIWHNAHGYCSWAKYVEHKNVYVVRTYEFEPNKTRGV